MQKSTNEMSIKEENTTVKKASSKASSSKKSSTKKLTNTTKKAASKVTNTTKNAKSKATNPISKKAKSSTTKKASTKNAKKSTTSRTKKATSSKTNKIRKTSSPKNKVEVLEYYDLPYRYNQTVVRILAQTPNTLFVYWDISDSDRKKYIKEFGEDFFQNTVPVLIVHNKTMNYSFEIEINDFANSWYFTVADSKCKYEIELGRRAKGTNNYMYVTSSNNIEAPNDHILFEKKQKTLFFRNVKTNKNFSKDASVFDFMKYAGRIYNIYDVYQKIYKIEDLQDLTHNPSSNF